MKLLLFLKLFMMPLTNLRVLLYLTIVWKITMQIIILLIILRESLPQRKRLMFCRTLWKKKLMKLKAPWMKKRRRVTNNRRKNAAIHLPSNESNSLNITLYECYDPMDSFEISLFDEVDAFYTCGHDAIMNDAYGDELPIVPRVGHEIVGH